MEKYKGWEPEFLPTEEEVKAEIRKQHLDQLVRLLNEGKE